MTVRAKTYPFDPELKDFFGVIFKFIIYFRILCDKH